ncbi:MAG: hypothetical protein WCK51_01575 [Armatimonadota bacterium]
MLPDRTVDLFVVYRGTEEVKIDTDSKFQKVGDVLDVSTVEIKGETNLEGVKVAHYQCAQGLYYGVTTITVGGKSQSFTVNEAEAIDEFSGLKLIAIYQADSPGRLGLRSPIAGISRSRNPAAAFLTFDAIAIIDPAANNPSLGAGITYNFSFGARQDENLEGRYGFPLFFSVTVGINGLGSSGQVGSGRPFIAPGITLRFRT